MQIADRLLKTPPYPFAKLAELKRQAIAEGVDLIDLGIGDPDLPTPPHIVDAMAEAIRDPVTHQYDETGMGLPEFRQAVADWYQARFGVALDPGREILRTIGAKEGIAHISWAVINPGDVALLPDPGYPVYKVSNLFAGGESVFMPLTAEKGFLPDLDAIPADAAKAAKMMFICYPNMPTAAVADLAFYERVVAFAKRHDLLVCLDMAYSEIGFDGYRCPSILQVPGAKDVAIEFHSLSKTYNMTGWRLGFAVGNAEALAALNKLKSNVDSGAFLAIQRAGVAALSGPQDCVREACAAYQRRRDLLIDGLNGLGWKLDKAQATFYVWAPVPQGYTSEQFASILLKDAGILLTPGSAYGLQGEGFIRMALTVQGGRPEERLREAVERIRTRVRVDWG
jgi:LL-diaminopimelate aminotransferase